MKHHLMKMPILKKMNQLKKITKKNLQNEDGNDLKKKMQTPRKKNPIKIKIKRSKNLGNHLVVVVEAQVLEAGHLHLVQVQAVRVDPLLRVAEALAQDLIVVHHHLRRHLHHHHQ